METRSELIRENRELRDRRELLEPRQENRNLQRQIARLEAGKKKHSVMPKGRKDWIALGCIAACWLATYLILTS